MEETNYFDLIDFIIPLLRVGVIVALAGAVTVFFFITVAKRVWTNKFKLFLYREW
ncbi:hypothetical protein [Priestia megaterium]|uniref:hypothetical protein n=1 Tax=Priestia megaterium TaxID=1404 RepID=UPI00366CAE0C